MKALLHLIHLRSLCGFRNACTVPVTSEGRAVTSVSIYSCSDSGMRRVRVFVEDWYDMRMNAFVLAEAALTPI